MHATCLHPDIYICSSRTAYIVVLAESVTADYFTSLIGTNDLEEEDPPAVCVAPSTGRFEVNGSTTSPPDLCMWVASGKYTYVRPTRSVRIKQHRG